MKDFLKKIKLNEGNLSLGLGIVVMLVAAGLLVNYFRGVNRINTQESRISSASTEVSPTPTTMPSDQIAQLGGSPTLAANPTVQPSATPKAPTITKAPTVTVAPSPTPATIVTPTPALNPGTEYTVANGDSLWKIAMKTYGNGESWKQIYENNKSALGNNPSQISTGTKIQLPKLDQTATNAPVEYIVKAGDNLWNVSVQLCGDGFVYSSIAQSNQIANPRIIHPGQKLTVTCPRRS